MMDITTLFKSRLEIVRKRNKELGTISSGESQPTLNKTGSTKSKLFPGKKAEYYSKARELSATITSLRDFLEENRSAYLSIGSSKNYGNPSNSVFAAAKCPASNVPTMTDTERDQIDSNVQKIIHNCQKRIFDYDRMIETTETIQSLPQLRSHLEMVSISLGGYLKDVCALYSEMRAIRVKRTVDYQAMSRLSAPASSSSLKVKERFNKDSSSFHGNTTNGKKSALPAADVDGAGPSSIPSYFLEDEIPPEELQILEEENSHLLNELNSLADEVGQIETSVVQIAQLQEIFTEKVLQQEKEIDKISTVVVGATENIRTGNEQIRQAIQKNADFRAWVLFFIIVMSFSLLFLDWYNE